jgi:hypothetical protein
MKLTMRRSGTHSSVLLARTNAREALFSALDNSSGAAQALSEAADELHAFAVPGFSSPSVTDEIRLFAVLIDCCARLVLWPKAVRDCEADADRYLRGAKLVLKESLVVQTDLNDDTFAEARRAIQELSDISGVPDVLRAVLQIPLPIAFPLEVARQRVPVSENQSREESLPIVVAFTSFEVNNQPFRKDQVLNFNIGYDLSVEIVLSRWPERESDLRLEPLSVEPIDAYSLPTFVFSRPNGTGPYTLRSTKRMVIKQAGSFLARPMEFSYRAMFLETKDITTEGQRHLSVRCFDPRSDPQSGYAQVDQKLVEIRDQARKFPAIDDAELSAFLVLMGAVGGVAGQSLQDNLFKDVWDEAAFQAELMSRLRARPVIGSTLEEHPHVGGGITDLSFNQIRLELKAVSDHPVTQADVDKHLPQIVQYVSGSDRRFGILCILDTYPKTSEPGSVADDINYITRMGPSGRGLPIGIGIIIIRGNLATPSSLSRQQGPTVK